MRVLVGLDKLTKNVSLDSLRTSPMTLTMRVWFVVPGAKFTMPLVVT